MLIGLFILNVFIQLIDGQDLNENEISLEQPLIYCHFAEGIGEAKYAPVKNWTQLVKLLDEALLNYNELVLSRLNIIISYNPRQIFYTMYLYFIFF